MSDHQVTPNLKRSMHGKHSYSHEFGPDHPYSEMRKQLERCFFSGEEFELGHRRDDQILYLSREEDLGKVRGGHFYHAEKFDSPLELLDEMYDLYDQGFFIASSRARFDREVDRERIEQNADLSAGALKNIEITWDIGTTRAWSQDYLNNLSKKARERVLSEIEVEATYNIHCKLLPSPNSTK